MLDWLRGIAILLMVIYHFCYDLFYFDYIDTAFGKGYWIPFRYVIVILFLSLVGTSLVLSSGKKKLSRGFITRALKLLLACVFVTASSYFIAPNKITVFGILHFILFASFLGLFFVDRPKLSLLLGIVIFTVGHIYQHPIFNPTAFHWLGMVTEKRPALDYVPVFPWFGIVLLGITLGHWINHQPRCREYLSSLPGSKATNFETPLETAPVSSLSFWTKVNKTIALAGQHSLLIYLVHQPLMFAGFWAIQLL